MAPVDTILKYQGTGTETGEKPRENSGNHAIVKPCPYCARLERALHDAIKLIERQQKTLEALKEDGNNVKP